MHIPLLARKAKEGKWMFMPFTAADLDKILAQQQPKEPAEEAVSHPIRVEGTTQALSFSAKRDCLFYLLGILFLVGVFFSPPMFSPFSKCSS